MPCEDAPCCGCCGGDELVSGQDALDAIHDDMMNDVDHTDFQTIGDIDDGYDDADAQMLVTAGYNDDIPDDPDYDDYNMVDDEEMY